MNSTLVYLVIIIIVAVIILSIDHKSELLRIEGFDESSQEDVGEGASSYYNWSYHPISRKKHHKKHHKNEKYCDEDIFIHREDRCTRIMDKCPIYDHPDINKFVLKSSVKPCADMSKYALKSDMCPCKDMKNYIKKSEIPPCPSVPDLRDYVLKSEIPSCPKIVCPECPICPKNYYPNEREKEIIRIEDHPNFGNYVRKEKIEELREKLRQCRENNSSLMQGDNGVVAYNNQYCPV
jgi:hypothetical protein